VLKNEILIPFKQKFFKYLDLMLKNEKSQIRKEHSSLWKFDFKNQSVNSYNSKQKGNPIMYNRKLAFTLAEVLITLGIIGVVAALTIPTLIKNYQKTVTVNQLKSVYTKLTQAVKLSEADNGAVSGWDKDMTKLEFFNTYLAPYLKVANYDIFGSRSYKRADGIVEGNFTLFKYSAKTVTLLDGTMLFLGMDNDISSSTSMTIGVDLNGIKNPNVIGKDFFVFVIPFDNDTYPKVVPYGAYGTSDAPFGEMKRENINKDTGYYSCACSKKGYYHRGQFCAALIMVDGWKISSDYPW
jgi:prepilin-type N-terminal cleavage/methylation domain-containing protein